MDGFPLAYLAATTSTMTSPQTTNSHAAPGDVCRGMYGGVEREDSWMAMLSRWPKMPPMRNLLVLHCMLAMALLHEMYVIVMQMILSLLLSSALSS